MFHVALFDEDISNICAFCVRAFSKETKQTNKQKTRVHFAQLKEQIKN